MIKITDGKNKTKYYKEFLMKHQLKFKYTGKYTGYWYTNDDSNYNELFKFCNKNKLKIEKSDERYSRSADYRENFFKENKGYKGNGINYHCAYCGKKLKKENLEVDHLLCIDAVKNHLIPRLYLKITGIKNINNNKNLVASCKRCNRKKSNKQGFWIIRGLIGKHIWFWRIFTLLLIILFIGVLFYGYSKGYYISIFNALSTHIQ